MAGKMPGPVEVVRGRARTAPKVRDGIVKRGKTWLRSYPGQGS